MHPPPESFYPPLPDSGTGRKGDIEVFHYIVGQPRMVETAGALATYLIFGAQLFLAKSTTSFLFGVTVSTLVSVWVLVPPAREGCGTR